MREPKVPTILRQPVYGTEVQIERIQQNAHGLLDRLVGVLGPDGHQLGYELIELNGLFDPLLVIVFCHIAWGSFTLHTRLGCACMRQQRDIAFRSLRYAGVHPPFRSPPRSVTRRNCGRFRPCEQPFRAFQCGLRHGTAGAPPARKESTPMMRCHPPRPGFRAVRRAGSLLTILAFLALPPDARASLFSPEVEDKLATFLALFVIFV